MNSNQIIARLIQKCNFHQGKEGNSSQYLDLGILTYRISNHCTHLWTWEYNYGRSKPLSMISLVFEDKPTQSQPILKYPIKQPFSVSEWVYHAQDLTLSDVDAIANEINQYKRNYSCPLGIVANDIVSVNPGIDVEVGLLDVGNSNVKYSNILLNKTYSDAIAQKKDILKYIQSHPNLDRNKIPVFSVIYNCPDIPRYIIKNYVHCNKRMLQTLKLKNSEALLQEGRQIKGKQIITLKESDIQKMVWQVLQEITDKKKASKKVGPNGYYIAKNGLDYEYKGEKRRSIISVSKPDRGQAYHIDEDDHCYIFYAESQGKTERYENPYIFDELLDAIKMLPLPS